MDLCINIMSGSDSDKMNKLENFRNVLTLRAILRYLEDNDKLEQKYKKFTAEGLKREKPIYYEKLELLKNKYFNKPSDLVPLLDGIIFSVETQYSQMKKSQELDNLINDFKSNVRTVRMRVRGDDTMKNTMINGVFSCLNDELDDVFNDLSVFENTSKGGSRKKRKPSKKRKISKKTQSKKRTVSKKRTSKRRSQKKKA